MDIIGINLEALGRDIGQMQTELQLLRSHIGLTYDSIKELNTMWNGPANEAFNQTFESDYQSMNEMCKMIKSLIEYMENARDQYRHCEDLVSQEIESIK
ncbi:WXG100 family type VII secretion target [Brotaphodocola sp.]|uniref:WXG100 family type VII secretion target n=1 Tax=Brotaphodocola sp. TaxID=3073577 RepID=UPI003D7E9CBB